jgi:hypothetical protein
MHRSGAILVWRRYALQAECRIGLEAAVLPAEWVQRSISFS